MTLSTCPVEQLALLLLLISNTYNKGQHANSSFIKESLNEVRSSSLILSIYIVPIIIMVVLIIIISYLVRKVKNRHTYNTYDKDIQIATAFVT